MSDSANLLVELLVEELPPKALKALGEAFATGLADSLKAQKLAATAATVTAFATPRRLAVHVTGVLAVAADERVSRKLMPTAVALDARGQATEALRKSLQKLGRAHLADAWPAATEGPDQLYIDGQGKGEALYLRSLEKGSSLRVGLQRALDSALARLPIPKLMSYQLADGWTSVQFVRPAHGLVALHGEEIVATSVLGLEAGRTTSGHRFLAAGPISLEKADDYEEVLLKQGKVIVGFGDRRRVVNDRLKVLTLSKESNGIIAPDALLDEVTALVEWPVVYECHFDADFLEVPQECLILTMQTNQKYFACTLEGALVNRFLVVSNIQTDDPSSIVQGNERVVRPRLADARFFFDQDRKTTLESRLPGLKAMVYHARLGTMGDRVARVCQLSSAIGRRWGGAELADIAASAARLAKADLLTSMVGEFPELQGVMGGYYARHEGLSGDVSVAIEDHYKPRYSGDELPRNPCGVVLALADKLETLAGMFGIGQSPSGDKDPFALRRHAIGVLRLLGERGLPLPLDWLVDQAFAVFPHGMPGQARTDLLAFLRDRLSGSLREQGYSAQEVDAVLARNSSLIDLVPQQLAAVRAFAALPEAASLAAANKRITNILAKSGNPAFATVDESLFTEDAERILHVALKHVQPLADSYFEARDYAASLRELAALKGPVDTFFDQVMVNAEDPALRANRLALLAGLRAAMNRVADLSRLAG